MMREASSTPTLRGSIAIAGDLVCFEVEIIYRLLIQVPPGIGDCLSKTSQSLESPWGGVLRSVTVVGVIHVTPGRFTASVHDPDLRLPRNADSWNDD
jgi:hypothetical protein